MTNQIQSFIITIKYTQITLARKAEKENITADLVNQLQHQLCHVDSAPHHGWIPKPSTPTDILLAHIGQFSSDAEHIVDDGHFLQAVVIRTHVILKVAYCLPKFQMLLSGLRNKFFCDKHRTLRQETEVTAQGA